MGVSQMSKQIRGIHLYININNLNKIIRKEENSDEDLRHSFHALDTFIASLEKFSQYFEDIITVEKFTTSRLHFYIGNTKGNDKMNEAFEQLSVFANVLAGHLTKIGKYKKVARFQIGIGADYGTFVEYEFEDKNTELKELTSIGSPANRAAKLQSVCDEGNILISKALYDLLNDETKNIFFGAGDVSKKVALKYVDLTAYYAKHTDILKTISSVRYKAREETVLSFATERANNTSLGSINFTDAKQPIDYSSLSLRNAKQVNGVMLYADIRGFTNKVEHSNLQAIEQLTKTVLSKMYKCTTDQDGIHIQFQGDRESAIFHKFIDQSEDFAVRAILSSMKMLDAIDSINQYRDQATHLDIGIGCAIGDIFASRIGLKSGKFNLVLGNTVKTADDTEDLIAGNAPQGQKSEIAITTDLFNYIKSLHDNALASQICAKFNKRGEYYVSSTRYSELIAKQFAQNETHTISDNTQFPLIKYGILDIPYRQKPRWILPKKPRISIEAYIEYKNTKKRYYSDSFPLEKELYLVFKPSLYNVSQPYEVYWQITNTGEAPKNDRRGEFISPNYEKNGRREHTSYTGHHLVQCFFVNGNQCIAKSNVFIVWVK